MPKQRRFPNWMRRKVTCTHELARTRDMLSDLDLNTVCQGARCPNMGECFSNRTATFMILGNTCTRGCRFCAVDKGKPQPVDAKEPQRVAEAAARLALKHVVVTSVTRDDLPDGGAQHFVEVIAALRRRLPGSTIEVLIPDLKGNRPDIDKIIAAKPDVINHNIETVPLLYSTVRPQADYQRSLKVLQQVKEKDNNITTKSGLMVGLGEKPEQVRQVMADLRRVHCDLLTIGQYLQPTIKHLPVVEYVRPEMYTYYRHQAQQLGFSGVEAGPYVRSSYKAGEMLK